jgi:hypothetical protein
VGDKGGGKGERVYQKHTWAPLSWQFNSLAAVGKSVSRRPTTVLPGLGLNTYIMEGVTQEGTSSAPAAPPNILSALHTLLLSTSPKSSAFAHPFAPAPNYGSWKGKAREGSIGVGLEEQQKILEQLSKSLQSASVAVGKAVREEGKVKLGRAMKEV